MKILKYFTILAAAAGIISACTSDLEQVQTLPKDQVVAPVLHDLECNEIVITSKTLINKFSMSWDAAYFGEQIVPSYSIQIAKADSDVWASIAVGITDTETKLTYEQINLAVTEGLGLPIEVAADTQVRIGATIGNSYQTFYSETKALKVTPSSMEKTYNMIYMPGSYQGWAPADAATKFQVLYEFAGNGVFEGIADFGSSADDSRQWKFTRAANWDFDWGIAKGDTPEAEAAEVTLINNDGGDRDNINIYTAKRFYHFTMDTNTGLLKHNYSFDQVGVVGAFTGWADGQDKVMEFNAAKRRFWVDVENLSGEFKFRTDGSWTMNWGGGAFGLEGDNLNCEEAGNYRVYLYLSNSKELSYELNADMYGKEEPVGGVTPDNPDNPDTPDTPDTPAEKEPNRWGIVGDITGWGNQPDLYMDEVGADLYARRGVTLTTADGFKIRFNDEWNDAKNYGLGEGGAVVLNEGFPVITSGASGNMNVPADGTYDVYFSLAEEKVWVMTEGQVPSDITLKAVKLYVDVTATGWENCNIYVWDDNNVNYAGNWPGQALTLEDGKYVWTAPAEVVGKTINVIFNNGDGAQTADIKGVVLDKDHTFVLNADLSYTIDGEAPAPPTPSEIKLTADVTATGWENCNIYVWDDNNVNYAGSWPGTALTLEDGKYVWTAPAEVVGKTINVIFNNGAGAQTADINGVVLDKDHHFVVNADLSYTMDGESKEEEKKPVVLGEHTWGVAGDHNGWGDSAMTAEDGWVVAKDLALEAGKKFKIRADGDWAINYGHAEENQNAKVGQEYELAFNAKDMFIETTGTYDVYFTIVDNVAKMKLIAK